MATQKYHDWTWDEWKSNVTKLHGVGPGTQRRANDYFSRSNIVPSDYFWGTPFRAHNLSVICGSAFHDYDEDGANYMSSCGGAWLWERSGYGEEVTFKKKFVPFGPEARKTSMHFGSCCAIWLRRICIGAPNYNLDVNGENALAYSGQVFVFEQDPVSLEWSGLHRLSGEEFTPNGRVGSPRFGMELEMYGDWLFVGAPMHDYDMNGENQKTNAGVIFVYKWNGTNEAYEAHSRISLPTAYRSLGGSTLFGGKMRAWYPYLVVGCPYHDYDEDLQTSGNQNRGAVHIFKYNELSDTWEHHQRLYPWSDSGMSDDDNYQYFGVDVDIVQDVLVAGYSHNDTLIDGQGGDYDSGAANIFRLVGEQWVFEKKVKGFGPDGRHTTDYFGVSVCVVDSNHVACGANGQDYDQDGDNYLSSAGAVYIWKRDDSGTWTEHQKLAGYDLAGNGRNASDMFGDELVSDHAGGILVGAWGHDYDADGANPISNAGAAFYMAGNWPIVDYEVYKVEPDSNALGKLLSVDGVVSRAVNFSTFDIPSNSLQLTLDDTDDHFWKQEVEQDIINTPVELKLYMDGVTRSGIVLQRGLISHYSFQDAKFICTVSDLASQVRNLRVPIRFVSPSTGFTKAGQETIDSLPQDARPIPIPYGELLSEKGAGTSILSDTDSNTYIVAGCTIEEISYVFVDGVSQVGGYTVDLGSQDADGDITAKITFDSDQAGAVITWNGKGKVKTGGDLIENGVDILVDIMTSVGGLGSGDFDLGSLGIAKTKIGDYKYAGIVGSRGIEVLGSIISNLAMSMNARTYFDFQDRFAIRIHDGTTGDPVLTLNTRTDFLEEPVIMRGMTEFVSGVRVTTRQIVQYKKRFQDNAFQAIYQIDSDVLRRQYQLTTHSDGIIESDWIRDDQTAAWVGGVRFKRFRKPLYVVRGKCFFEALEGELGDFASITREVQTHDSRRYDWDGKFFEVVGVALNPNDQYVTMTFLEA